VRRWLGLLILRVGSYVLGPDVWIQLYLPQPLSALEVSKVRMLLQERAARSSSIDPGFFVSGDDPPTTH
jgi:hypothetical protein